MIIDNKFQFEDRYDSELYETTTFYIIAPKEILGDKYPDAEFATLSIEVPTERMFDYNATVMVSPTKYDEQEEGYMDYDWCDLELPLEDIRKLLDIGMKGFNDY